MDSYMFMQMRCAKDRGKRKDHQSSPVWCKQSVFLPKLAVFNGVGARTLGCSKNTFSCIKWLNPNLTARRSPVIRTQRTAFTLNSLSLFPLHRCSSSVSHHDFTHPAVNLGPQGPRPSLLWTRGSVGVSAPSATTQMRFCEILALFFLICLIPLVDILPLRVFLCSGPTPPPHLSLRSSPLQRPPGPTWTFLLPPFTELHFREIREDYKGLFPSEIIKIWLNHKWKSNPASSIQRRNNI